MKYIITERQSKQLRRVIKEEEENEEYWKDYGFDDQESYVKDFAIADEYAQDLVFDLYSEINSRLVSLLNSIDIDRMISDRQEMFMERYENYAIDHEDIANDNVTHLMELNTNIDVESIADAMEEALALKLESK